MNTNPVAVSADETQKVERRENVAVGQWYWVSENEGREPWLGCLMEIGSNFVELESPHGRAGHKSTRVHLDAFFVQLRREPAPHEVIAAQIAKHQGAMQIAMAEIQTLTARLGLSASGQSRLHSQAESGTSLMVLSGQADVKLYERALVRAKEEELPALFKRVEQESRELTTWMAAEMMPIIAETRQMKSLVGEVNARIFNVSLYAGLTEDVVMCCDGQPAGLTDKLHVMQARLYMDEQCLLGYRAGGMEFKDIGQFDRWMAEPENRDRILPFPRCLVAMQVRRKTKKREFDGKLLTAFINLRLEHADKLTFLYIRNGERVYRMSTDLDFDEMIFPDKAMLNLSEPMMVRMFCNRVDKMITRREYDQCVAEQEADRVAKEKWRQANPREGWSQANPGRVWEHAHRSGGYRPDFNPYEWKPFDRSNLYFDEISKSISEQVQKYNRVALIIQGLFDRSDVLHPHLPVRTWTPEGFDAAIELVYDGSGTLHAGEAPDFEAYRAKCNESLTVGSHTVGQRLHWLKREAEKENARRKRSIHYSRFDVHEMETYEPPGDAGPDYVAAVAEWKPRSRQASFTWTRERRGRDSWRQRDELAVRLIVPEAELFNVDAYKPGDYLQFFQDARTRADYLKWAPMLLAAEEFHAKKGRS